jgi:hypothetical protein
MTELGPVHSKLKIELDGDSVVVHHTRKVITNHFSVSSFGGNGEDSMMSGLREDDDDGDDESNDDGDDNDFDDGRDSDGDGDNEENDGGSRDDRTPRRRRRNSSDDSSDSEGDEDGFTSRRMWDPQLRRRKGPAPVRQRTDKRSVVGKGGVQELEDEQTSVKTGSLKHEGRPESGKGVIVDAQSGDPPKDYKEVGPRC